MATPSPRKAPPKKLAARTTAPTTVRKTVSRKKPLGLHDYLFPHKGNKYKPHIFRTASLTAIVVGLVVLQGVYLAQTNFVFTKTNFLATVLPAALISLTNTDRAASSLAPVTEDPMLDEAAQNVANDMAAKGYFAHVSPSGQTPWSWLQAIGYKYSFAGENLAVNFDDSDQVESAWMQSPTHRANIEKPEYTKVGIGVANGMYEGKNVTFVAEFFATPPAAGEPAPTPLNEPTVQQGTPATVPTPTGSGEIALANPTTSPVAAATVPAPTAAEAATTAHTKALIASEVLGTQTSQQLASAPVSAVTAPAGTQGSSAAAPVTLTPDIASKTPSPLDFAAQVATSPTQTILYILGALAFVVAILLIIELSVKARLKYLEMTGGGLALLALLIVMLVFNVFTAPRVLITNDSQPAQTASNGS
jgi:uncharacterized protein YkwD